MGSTVGPLTEFEMDALREVATVGAGHAATALSQLTGSKVLITVPYVDIVPIAEVPGLIEHREAPMAGMYMRVMGDGSGAILLAFGREAALSLVDLMMGRPSGEAQLLSEMEQSALREAGNIIAGSFLTAISNFLQVLLLPSVPRLALDMIGALIESLLVESKVNRDFALVMYIRFQAEGCEVGGHFLMVPDSRTMGVLLEAIEELSRRAGGA